MARQAHREESSSGTVQASDRCRLRTYVPTYLVKSWLEAFLPWLNDIFEPGAIIGPTGGVEACRAQLEKATVEQFTTVTKLGIICITKTL